MTGAGAATVPSPPAARAPAAPASDRRTPAGVRVVLQVSRFPWGEDPAGWLTGVALEADRLGFALRALWAAGTKAWQGTRVGLPETTCYPRRAGALPIIVGGSGERRTLRIAARLGDGCNLPSDPQVLAAKVAVLRAHCADVGRDPAEVAVTVLDLPVVGHDRDDAWRRVERLRGRTAAATYAARHHAGPGAAHAERYEKLAGEGVETVFLALADLTGPEDLERLAPLLA